MASEPITFVGMVYNDEKKEVYVSYLSSTDVYDVSDKNKYDTAGIIDGLTDEMSVSQLYEYIGKKPTNVNYMFIPGVIMEYIHKNKPGVYAMQPIKSERVKSVDVERNE